MARAATRLPASLISMESQWQPWRRTLQERTTISEAACGRHWCACRLCIDQQHLAPAGHASDCACHQSPHTGAPVQCLGIVAALAEFCLCTLVLHPAFHCEGVVREISVLMQGKLRRLMLTGRGSVRPVGVPGPAPAARLLRRRPRAHPCRLLRLRVLRPVPEPGRTGRSGGRGGGGARCARV